ncbi:MAG: glycoside hydrolase family 5 protein [Actinomycetota bacterium]|nr:glycoside hydrolase family 5 protein [Actinomycetota bacterium]
MALSVAILAILTTTTLTATTSSVAMSSAASAFQAQTAISLSGRLFAINGHPTYRGTAARGLLLNTRMVQAVFDDANPDTTWQWEYPDTHVWDPQRNTDEFVAMLPRYAAKGVNMVTVGLQGGNPDPLRGTSDSIHPEIVTGFEPDGSLDPAWLGRLDQVIRAADALGMIVDLSLFYRFQDQWVTTDAGVVNAVDNITDWLVNGGYTNVMMEVCNECNVGGFDHDNLSPDNVWQLIKEVQDRSNGRILTSASFGRVNSPVPESVIAQADFITVHCDQKTRDEMLGMLDQIRSTDAYQAAPKPIVANECATDLWKMDLAIAHKVSWGYFDQGANDYVDGFQSPPVNWRINTSLKRAFFRRASEYATGLAPSG